MNDHADILLAILGELDATFWPVRKWSGCRHANAWQAQRDYMSRGVAFRPTDKSEAGRKAAQRGLEQLASDGMVTVTKGDKKQPFVRLSDDAEMRMRKLVGMATIEESYIACLDLAKHAKPDPLLMTEKWVCERTMLGTPVGVVKIRELNVVTSRLLPAMVRGFVEVGSDTMGRAYFALTPAGWVWIKVEGLGFAEVPGERDDEARAIYMDAFDSAFERMDAAKVVESELGFIPLPCSMAGEMVSKV